MAKKAFSWSPIRKLMKDAGVELIARNAVDELIEYLESSAQNISSKALELAKHSGRKKVTKNDIKLAMDLI